MKLRTLSLLPAAILWAGFCTSQALAQPISTCIDTASYADCVRALAAAPSEVSFLGEGAVKARLGLISTIQDQIALSRSHRGPSGIDMWIGGGAAGLSMKNYPGFPDDPDIMRAGTLGADYALSNAWTVGFALSGQSLRSSLGEYGSFSVDDKAVSLYAAVQEGSIWANAIGTYGRLGADFSRIVHFGAQAFGNNGSTTGSNGSVALQGGYTFQSGNLTYGPVAGFVYQHADIAGYTETGSPFSLAFGSQTLVSAVGQSGYLATYDLGKYQPYIEASWNHEFADAGRDVTASSGGFSYSMPAVVLGKDWGEAKGGLKIDAGGGIKLVVEGTADFGQTSANLYGGQIGINAAF